MISVSTPRLGLNLDEDLSNVKDGSYVDANNVRIKSDGSTNGYLLTNTNGNEYGFTIDDIQPTNRKWYIKDGDPLITYSLSLRDNQGNVIVETLFELTFSSLISQFAADCAALSISVTIVSDSSEATIEVTEWPHYDYSLVSYNPENFSYFYLVQESVDGAESAIAVNRILNSCEALDGVYIFSTNQALQKSYDYTYDCTAPNTQDNGSGVLQLTNITPPKFLHVGSYFKINITGSTDYNGSHIAKYVATNTVDIIDVPFTTQQVLTYTYYFSNYGRITYVDYVTGSATTIFGTPQWDFSIFNPIDSRVEQSSLGYDQLYFCSLQDINRVFYLQTGDTIYNTALFGADLVPPYHYLRGGQYTYESILEQTAMVTTNKSIVSYISQSQSGGKILAGNWRYATSLLTASGAETALTDLTQPIPVYKENANSSLVVGNEGTVETGKINNLQVTNIIAGVYKYVVLYGFHYADGAVMPYRIKQQLLDNSDTLANISHEGTETYELTSFGELKFVTLQYYSKNIELVDNYLTFSNLRQKGNPDLTDFAKSATHNIQKEYVGTGEYKNPLNVNTKMGCMLYEDYVWAAQFELMDGSFTDQVYYINTIRIDGNTTNNAANPNRVNGGRVAGGISDTSITDASGNPYYFYPNIIFDWTTLIGAYPAHTIIKSVKFYRAEVINPRVIACGFIIPNAYGNGNQSFLPSGTTTPSITEVCAFPNAFGDVVNQTTYPLGDVSSDYNSDFVPGVGPDPGTQSVSFYAPDYFYTGNHFTSIPGDLIKILPSQNSFTAQYLNNPNQYLVSSYNAFYGYPDGGNTYDVLTSTYCPTGSTVSLVSRSLFNLLYVDGASDESKNQFNCFDCQAVEFNTFADISIDYATYGYYIRPRADQYGDLTLLKYSYTGVSDISIIGITETLINNGGDTFTQQSAIKQRVKVELSSGAWQDTGASLGAWQNTGASFYTQNRINSQMRVISGTQYTFQRSGITNWLCNVEPEAFDYNSGYSIFGNDYIKNLTPFNPELNTVTNYSTRAVWTNKKPAGSLVDDYRTLPPLNFSDFPMQYGGITSHISVNGNLMVLQELKFSLKYFNSEGQFTTTSSDTILLGENAVMSRREQDISIFGCSHKQSISKGVSDSGKEVLYWVCSKYKKIMRFGADGTVCISDRAAIKSWCENNILTEFNEITESTTGRGISSVWNQKDREYIVTFRYGTDVTNPLTLKKTITFSEVTNRFVSFMGFAPTIYVRFLNYFYTPNSISYLFYPSNTSTTSESTGDCYIHNDDLVTDNEFFPTYYDSDEPDTDVTLVTNADVIDNKMFQNFEIDYEGVFADVNFATKTQTSAVGDSEYALDLYRGQVGLDENENPMNGIWIKTLITFGTSEMTKLKRFTMKYLTSNRLTQR